MERWERFIKDRNGRNAYLAMYLVHLYLCLHGVKYIVNNHQIMVNRKGSFICTIPQARPLLHHLRKTGWNEK